MNSSLDCVRYMHIYSHARNCFLLTVDAKEEDTSPVTEDVDNNHLNTNDTCSILGMYLFGGKFCKFTDDATGQERECTCPEIVSKHPQCECDRKHFNNFLWATVTVFQVRTEIKHITNPCIVLMLSIIIFKRQHFFSSLRQQLIILAFVCNSPTRIK